MQINNIYHGDCLELMNNIEPGSVDMILCDLPYGTTRSKWDIIIPFEPLWGQYNRIIKPNGVIGLFGAEPFASMLRLSNIRKYKYDWVWNKVKGTGFLNAKKQPMRNHETISIFYSKQPVYNPQKTTGHVHKSAFRPKSSKTDVYGPSVSDSNYSSTERYPRSILQYSTDIQKSCIHPNQKPVALCEYLIKTYTNPGDLVLDNCIGSGTTAIACINTGRNYIGIEKYRRFVTASIDRITSHSS